jgi:polysaccharide chain length determinant protein (PEP-CTERM system associated)
MEEEGILSPGDYLAILRQRKWSLILPMVGIMVLSLAVAFLLPAVYRSEATIFIEEQEVPTDFVASTVTTYAEQRIQAIYQRIMTFTPLLNIINEHGLYPEMRGKYTSEEIVEKMRLDTTLEPISTEILDRRTGRPGTATIAFVLGYEGRNSQKVLRVANKLVSLFLEQNLKQRVQQVEETSSFLESEIARIKIDLSKSESELADFKQKHINELPEMMQVNLQGLNNIERSLESINQQISSLKERESYFQSQVANQNPSLSNESRSRLEELKIQLVALTKNFSDEYPDVKKTRAEIAELEQILAASGSSSKALPNNPAYITLSAQLASAQAELNSVQEQRKHLLSEAAEYKRRMAATPGVEDEYNALISTRRSNQDKYEDLLAKLMEAKVAHGLEKGQKGERFTLAEAPRLPEKPFKPNRLIIVVIGIVLGIGAGVGTLALREFTDMSVRSADRLSQLTAMPILATVPIIVTPHDVNRRRMHIVLLSVAFLALVAIGITIFHFQVMDLDIFWVKLMRNINM